MSTYPIVGAHYRPPAKAILQCLPGEHPLILRREPDNPYDTNAIQVLVDVTTIEDLALQQEIDEASQDFGYDWETISQESEVHLGYIPKTLAEVIASKFDDEGGEIPGTLTFNVKGAPMVHFELPEDEEESQDE